jgi:hypothetical protein
MVAAKALDFHIEAARVRQRVAGIEHSDNLKKGNEVIPRLVASLPQAGKLLKVSGRSVAAAAVVLKHGTDDEKKDVETGTVGLAKVEKLARVRAKNTARPEE